jgi:hypothetical protein
MDVTDKAQIRVSSNKSGHSAERLLDTAELGTFWQSDAQLPHFVQIDLPSRMPLSELRLYMDHVRDESYTPCEIMIYAGDHASSLSVPNV